MIQTVMIDSLEKAMQLLEMLDYNPEIDRLRSHYYFHGSPDSRYHLVTSLARNCKQKQKELEPSILKSFTKYAVIDDPSLSTSVWKQMIVGQHHGLPTRLLDWTLSPLVALHFATTENNLQKMSNRDGAVWCISASEIHSILPEKYRQALAEEKETIFSLNTMQRCAATLEQYDSDMQDSAFALIEPPTFDPRIMNQYAFFSIIPSGMEDIERFLNEKTEQTVKYIISREIRWVIRDLLDQLNINERIIYPGLDGISAWVARHYFVKD